MKNFKNLLLLILPIWSFNLFANVVECSKKDSTLEIEKCFVNQLSLEEKRLDKIMNQVLRQPSWISKEIQDSHNSWVRYRDTHCAAVYSSYGRGSMRLIAYPSCVLDMTTQRINSIQSDFILY